jgi:hypothetical protein
MGFALLTTRCNLYSLHFIRSQISRHIAFAFNAALEPIGNLGINPANGTFPSRRAASTSSQSKSQPVILTADYCSHGKTSFLAG